LIKARKFAPDATILSATNGKHRCLEKAHVLSDCLMNYERGQTAEKNKRAKFKNNKIDGTSMMVALFTFIYLKYCWFVTFAVVKF
jgi:hypothetical protein